MLTNIHCKEQELEQVRQRRYLGSVSLKMDKGIRTIIEMDKEVVAQTLLIIIIIASIGILRIEL